MIQNKFQLQDFQVGLTYLLQELKKRGYEWRNIVNKNNRRYMLVFGHTGFPNYFMMFKRNPFFSHGIIFKGKPETGETINAIDLQNCFKHNVEKIFVIYDKGNIYFQTPIFWATEGFKRKTDNEEKVTYSISIKDLKRWNKDQEKKV